MRSSGTFCCNPIVGWLENQGFSLKNVSWLLDTRKDAMKKDLVLSSCLRRTTSNDGVVGVARGAVFQQIRPGVGFKTSDFVQEMLGGGYIVERVRVERTHCFQRQFWGAVFQSSSSLSMLIRRVSAVACTCWVMVSPCHLCHL